MKRYIMTQEKTINVDDVVRWNGERYVVAEILEDDQFRLSLTAGSDDKFQILSGISLYTSIQKFFDDGGLVVGRLEVIT